MADLLTDTAVRVRLRPATPEDRDFLVAVYRSTREAELELTGWAEPERAAFIEMQFTAQERAYREAYPDGRFLVILRDGVPAGRLCVARLADELRIADIALLPEHRGFGIGSRLIADILAEADASGIPVRLHVEPWNPARRLYDRLGFTLVEQRGIYAFMERAAGRPAGGPAS